MLNRFITATMLLVLVALASPHQSCLCFSPVETGAAPAHAAAEGHDCCSPQPSPVATGPSSGDSCRGLALQNCRTCCGAGGLLPPASVAKVALSDCQQELVALTSQLLDRDSGLDGSSSRLQIAATRGPPFLTGFGSSKTYLYKRALLI